jgi:hypothetical protein
MELCPNVGARNRVFDRREHCDPFAGSEHHVGVKGQCLGAIKLNFGYLDPWATLLLGYNQPNVRRDHLRRDLATLDPAIRSRKLVMEFSHA